MLRAMEPAEMVLGAVESAVVVALGTAEPAVVVLGMVEPAVMALGAAVPLAVGCLERRSAWCDSFQLLSFRYGEYLPML